jgi:ornithine lipid hydroxylase
MSPPAIGRLLRRTLYPGILGGSLLAVTLLFDRLGPVWATSLVNVAAGLCIVAAELTLTYRPRWRRGHGDLPTDLCYLALSAVAALVAAGPLMAGLASLALWLQAQVGSTIWPRHWPAAVQLPLALLVYELGSYGFHHLSHHTRLWRLHSVHHSVRRLYGLNSIRSHPIDFLFAVITTSGPLLLLGIDERLFAQVTVLGTVNMWLQHANADLETGFLDWVFVTPNVHRWHHSRRLDEQQRNLGAVLLVWDVVFGTRLAPPDRAPPEDVGPGHFARYPDTFLAQLAAPFRPALWRSP